MLIEVEGPNSNMVQFRHLFLCCEWHKKWSLYGIFKSKNAAEGINGAKSTIWDMLGIDCFGPLYIYVEM